MSSQGVATDEPLREGIATFKNGDLASGVKQVARDVLDVGAKAVRSDRRSEPIISSRQ